MGRVTFFSWLFVPSRAPRLSSFLLHAGRLLTHFPVVQLRWIASAARFPIFFVTVVAAASVVVVLSCCYPPFPSLPSSIVANDASQGRSGSQKT